jgi:hypothetical protein
MDQQVVPVVPVVIWMEPTAGRMPILGMLRLDISGVLAEL